MISHLFWKGYHFFERIINRVFPNNPDAIKKEFMIIIIKPE